MIKKDAVIATTHVDSDGDKIAIEALYRLVHTIRSSYIPIWNEHDPRKPPLGRIADAEVRERDDGEFEVVALLEFFDGSEPDSYIGNREHVRETQIEKGELIIVPDRSFKTKEDSEDIKAISELFGSKPTESVKKSVDPISILQITAAFVAGGVVSGFLGKLGSDASDVLKAKIKSLMGRKKNLNTDRVLRLVFQLEKDGYSIDADIFITNPTDQDIENLLERGLSQIDSQVPLLMSASTQLSKLTFEYKDGNLDLKFGVRKDCVPVDVKLKSQIEDHKLE